VVKNGFGHLRPFEYEYRFTEYEDEYEYRFTEYEDEEIRPEARTIIDTWYLILAY